MNGYGQSLRYTWYEAWRRLQALGRRAWLALLGVVVGTASVVALLNIGQGAEREAAQAFQGMGSDMLVVNFMLMPGMYGQRRPVVFDMETLARSISGVAVATPLMPVSMLARFEGYQHSVNIVGTTPAFLSVFDVGMASGRFLSVFDHDATHVVLGASVAGMLHQDGQPVRLGEHVQLGDYLFQVIGILQPRQLGPFSPVQADESIFLHISGVRRLGMQPEINALVVKAGNTANMSMLADDLTRYLAPQAPSYQVEVQVPQQLLDAMSRQASAFSYLLAGMGGISLLVGGIGIMNVMLMNVAERRREIGVRAALGARPVDIGQLFLAEAVVLAGGGAAGGGVVGVATGYLYTWWSGWQFQISWLSVALGVLAAVLVGIFSGVYPAWIAARLEPVQALRDDY